MLIGECLFFGGHPVRFGCRQASKEAENGHPPLGRLLAPAAARVTARCWASPTPWPQPKHDCMAHGEWSVWSVWRSSRGLPVPIIIRIRHRAGRQFSKRIGRRECDAVQGGMDKSGLHVQSGMGPKVGRCCAVCLSDAVHVGKRLAWPLLEFWAGGRSKCRAGAAGLGQHRPLLN